MSRYRRGDVVLIDFSFFDKEKGRFDFKPRPFVVINVIEEFDDENITVMCTTKTHKSEKYPGVVVLATSDGGKQMKITEDSLIYCNKSYLFSNKEILRRIGTCPFVDQIEQILYK